MIGDIIKHPVKALHSRNEKKTMHLLLLNSLFVSAASFIVLLRFSTISTVYFNASAAVASALFLMVFFGTLFAAFLLQTALNVLGGKGRYKEALACVTYSITAPSAGLFVSSLALFLPFAGALFSLILLSLTFAQGFATLFQGIKELFRVDMLVSFVSVLVVALALTAAVYSLAILNLATNMAGG